MKSLLVALAVIGLFVGVSFAEDNQVYQPYGQMNLADTPANIDLYLSSYTVQMSTAVGRGVQRIFANNSANTIFMSKTSATSVAANGLPLFTKTTYIEDKYFGVVYFIGEPATTTSDLRIEVIKSKY